MSELSPDTKGRIDEFGRDLVERWQLSIEPNGILKREGQVYLLVKPTDLAALIDEILKGVLVVDKL